VEGFIVIGSMGVEVRQGLANRAMAAVMNSVIFMEM